MKNRVFHIVFIAFLGLFAVPVVSHACGAKATGTEKAKCSKSKAEKLQSKHLPERKTCGPKDSHDPCGKDCGGKCDHISCKCIATCLSTTIIAPVEVKPDFQFAGLNDQKSLFQPAHISSGFYFIWLPPKIS